MALFLKKIFVWELHRAGILSSLWGMIIAEGWIEQLEVPAICFFTAA